MKDDYTDGTRINPRFDIGARGTTICCSPSRCSKSTSSRPQGLLNYDQTRRETAIGARVQGPNKTANVPTHP